MNAYIELGLIIIALITCACLSSLSHDKIALILAIVLTCALAPFSIRDDAFQDPRANDASWITAGTTVAYFSIPYIIGVHGLLHEFSTEDCHPWTFKNTISAIIGLSVHCLLFLIPLMLAVVGATLALRRATYVAIIGSRAIFASFH